ncbi:hypothetical protein [Smaragdicoccus niigatensis]|uniref:hypothetical protein n=1 Tax=Smaragdicoccus niigatensis TaxID=359359 RepID=UPI00036E2890|nr:hypothetical protein [Smaragdicoccus niigatensis]
MKRPFILTTVYTISSIVLGPLIFLTAVGFLSGGGDYCQPGIPEQVKIAEYWRAEIILTVAPGLMIVVGAALLGWLWVSIAQHRHDRPGARKPTILGAVVTLLALVMMCGYLVLVAHADLSAGQSC